MRITGKDINEITSKYIDLSESGCVANMGVGSPSIVVVDAPGSNAAGGSGIPKGRYPGQISNVNAAGAQNSAAENNEEESCQDEQLNMAKTQLLIAADRAVEMFDILHRGANLEPWAASKITLASDYLETVADYLKYSGQVSNDDMQVIPIELENALTEAKQRLDKKCWKGKHKEGTKMKGGIRVNNCVPNKK